MKKIFKKFLGKGLGGNFIVKHTISKLIVFLVNPITVFGSKLYVDYSDGITHIFRKYKKFQMQVCMENLKEGQIVLDVGANIGYFAIVASKVIKAGKIYCFEAAPKNCALIRKNIKVNKCQNIILENKAVSDKTGKVKVYLTRDTFYNSLYREERTIGETEIEGVSIDDYFRNFDKIDFMKVDVVGSEAKVIEGAKETIAKNPNMKIMMEFCPARIRELERSPLEMLLKLKNFGFNLFKLDLDKEKLEEITDCSDMVKDDTTKYLFFKK